MNRFAPVFIIIAAALWGVDGIVFRPALSNLPVSLVVFTESTIAAILLSPILFKKYSQLKTLNKKDWLALFLAALFGGALGTMAITKALFYVNYVNLSVVILIQKLQPIFALSLAAITLKERLPKIFFLWAGIAIIGAYFITFGLSAPNFQTGDKTWIATGFSLIAALSFSSSTIFSKRALQAVSYEMGTYLRFLFTAVIMLIIILPQSNLSSIAIVSPTQWIIFLLIALTTGGAAIFLYYFGLKKIPASVAIICELAFPLTAVVLEYFLHGNMLTPIQWVGVVILIASIVKVSGVKFGSNK